MTQLSAEDLLQMAEQMVRVRRFIDRESFFYKYGAFWKCSTRACGAYLGRMIDAPRACCGPAVGAGYTYVTVLGLQRTPRSYHKYR